MSGARLEKDVGLARLRGDRDQRRQVCRRRELLEPDLVLASHGVCGEGLNETRQRSDRRKCRLLSVPKMLRERCFEQVVSVALRPNALRRRAPVQGFHRPEEIFLGESAARDVLRDVGDRCAQAIVGLLEKVGHGLLLMLNRIRSSPFPLASGL